jgi:hypothetical protein
MLSIGHIAESRHADIKPVVRHFTEANNIRLWFRNAAPGNDWDGSD